MKIAIVHDWLVTYAGAERVLEKIIELYPNSDIFSLIDFIPENKRGFLKNKFVQTSFIQKLPFARTKYRNYLPLMPLAIEQFDLSKYDLIISSSHCVAKGVLTGPDQLHICMCYSPIRYAWDLQHQYLRESNIEFGLKSFLVRYFLHKIRIWDLRTNNSVDYFISISLFIKKRIKKIYRRDSEVIYPPVFVDDFKTDNTDKEDFYITSSRMVPYKKIDLIVRTFTNNFKEKKLIVIGSGPDYRKIEKIAGENVILLGYQEFSVLREKLQKAKAFIFAAEEDFGIAPIEAQAAGTPVIAYAKGGALETIQGLNCNNPTGVFFYEQTEASLSEAIDKYEQSFQKIKREDCIKNAEKFSEEIFSRNLVNFINKKIDIWRDNK